MNKLSQSMVLCVLIVGELINYSLIKKFNSMPELFYKDEENVDNPLDGIKMVFSLLSIIVLEYLQLLILMVSNLFYFIIYISIASIVNTNKEVVTFLKY